MKKLQYLAIIIYISLLPTFGYGISINNLIVGPNPLLQSNHAMYINYIVQNADTHTAQFYLYSVRGRLEATSNKFTKTNNGDQEYMIFENTKLQSLQKQLYILIGVFNNAGKTERKRTYVIVK
jgi:hypothetical protein